jgi:large subunit ribosomal protein L1
MIVHSNRYNTLKNLITRTEYSLLDAITVLKTLGTAKFTESIEAHIALNIDPKYPNQQLRTSLTLPHGNGKSIKIAVFTNSSVNLGLLKKDAFLVGFEEIIESIINGKIFFDVLITTPDLMPQLAKFGKILGPKGLMPSPKAGTVTQDLIQTVKEFKKGKFEYRADRTGIVHLISGKINFSELEIKENLICLYSSIEKNKPSGVKGRYFNSFVICTTMSPSIKIDLGSFKLITAKN